MTAGTVFGLLAVVPAFIASYSFQHGDVAWGIVCVLTTVLLALVSLVAIIHEEAR